MSKASNLDAIAKQLDQSDNYLVVRKYIEPTYYHLDDSIEKYIGAFLDVEVLTSEQKPL